MKTQAGFPYISHVLGYSDSRVMRCMASWCVTGEECSRQCDSHNNTSAKGKDDSDYWLVQLLQASLLRLTTRLYAFGSITKSKNKVTGLEFCFFRFPSGPFFSAVSVIQCSILGLLFSGSD